MKIRKILSRISATLVASAALATATGAQTQSNAEKLRLMAQFYGVATYALGANDQCDLLDQGEYRGLVVLRDALARDLSRATTAEVFASLDHAPTGVKDWKRGCLARRAHDTEWRRIDNARLIAHALQAAPAVMTRDPEKCWTGNMAEKLPRSDWALVAALAARHHANGDRATFDGLQKMFAGLIDTDCARTQGSSLLQAGFDALWLAEDNARADAADNGPGSSLAGKYQSVVVAKELGPWRLRRGAFNGSWPRDGINAFRLVDRGDTDTAFLYLTSIGLFGGPRGELFFRPKGGWTARLGGNAAAVALSLSDGTTMPLTKLSGSGSEGLGSARFELPKSSIAALAGKADATVIHIKWQDGDGKWTSFYGLGKDPQPQKFTLAQLREAIAWAVVPRPE
ncbi:MAG: hypothetical protein RIA72_04845 [Sphingopyxis sp.]|uniref:hypothetical protein n=1 Tax=Sphingopyxis sp. TaxID=1908224 RepID=UPI0032EC8448